LKKSTSLKEGERKRGAVREKKNIFLKRMVKNGEVEYPVLRGEGYQRVKGGWTSIGGSKRREKHRRTNHERAYDPRLTPIRGIGKSEGKEIPSGVPLLKMLEWDGIEEKTAGRIEKQNCVNWKRVSKHMQTQKKNASRGGGDEL